MPSGPSKGNRVAATADRLRDMVFATEPDSLLGSLQEVAKRLEVGVVTLQQAARILEHEGLLDVRRGPGGGFYGIRPGTAALERSIAAFLRSNPTTFEEAVNITSLLFNELAPAAADCTDPALRGQMTELLEKLDACTTDRDCGAFEAEFQDLLFRMVRSPLFQLLTVVTLQVGVMNEGGMLRHGDESIAAWITGRKRIITAILQGDRQLARFEADRNNRQAVLAGMIGQGAK